MAEYVVVDKDWINHYFENVKQARLWAWKNVETMGRGNKNDRYLDIQIVYKTSIRVEFVGKVQWTVLDPKIYRKYNKNMSRFEKTLYKIDYRGEVEPYSDVERRMLKIHYQIK